MLSPPPSPSGFASALYVSRARVAKAEVPEIVSRARVKNELNSLTGGMVYTGNYFAQALEGPVAALEATMALIAADPRHDSVTLLIGSGPVRERQFEMWTMGYVNAPSADRLISELIGGTIDAHKSAELKMLLLEWFSGGK